MSLSTHVKLGGYEILSYHPESNNQRLSMKFDSPNSETILLGLQGFEMDIIIGGLKIQDVDF